ncbi:MAG: hypothetical protein ACQGVK_00290 [Myxococcota bacterium]
MRKCKWIGLIAVGVMLFAGSANAAPVARPADVSVSITIQGLDSIAFSSSGSVSVDEATSQVILPAALATLPTPIAVPVTSSTAVFSITASTVSNQAGTISPSGAAGISGEPACPPAATGVACAVQTGIGGVVGFTGSVAVHVVQDVVVIPVNLNAALIGQGGTATDPFTFDAAPWTTKTGQVNLGTTIAATSGTVSDTGSRFTLVTPTFVNALNNVLPLFSTFEVAFTDAQGLPSFMGMPEPTALLAVGSVIGALALMARRRS